MIRIAAILTLAPAAAGAFDLAFPLDCTLGDTCFIQQYPDRDASSAAQDFTCGPLSYDGHGGTDLALPTLADMARGVAVLAAADGVVRALRDDMPDISVAATGAPDVAGKDCGNGVVLVHPDGWETQYCHMRQGSIAVKQGAAITAGTPLGLVGLSGRTEFPHLHLAVRRDGVDIDPFDPDSTLDCGQTAPALWVQPLPYTSGGIIGAGFATAVPGFDAVKAGLPVTATLPADAPALVVWAHMFGLQRGDSLLIDIIGPDGRLLAQTERYDKAQARAFRAIGKKRPAAGWPNGVFTGTVSHLRAGQVISSRTTQVQISP